MRMQVRLSAGLAHAAGLPRVWVELPPQATVAMLHGQLGAAYPGLQDLLPAAVTLVGDRVLGPDEELPDGVEVAILLPAAGGETAPGPPALLGGR